MCDHLILDGVRPAVVQSLEEKVGPLSALYLSLPRPKWREKNKTPKTTLLQAARTACMLHRWAGCIYCIRYSEE